MKFMTTLQRLSLFIVTVFSDELSFQPIAHSNVASALEQIPQVADGIVRAAKPSSHVYCKKKIYISADDETVISNAEIGGHF